MEFDHERARCDSYRALSDCYLLPEHDLGEKVSNLRATMEIICPEAAESISCDIQDIGTLLVDYSQLLLGPYKLLAPPYGSMYLEDHGLVMGNSTIDVKKRYMEEGLVPPPDLKEAPDHISIELEFMYYLIFKEILALSESDQGSAMDSLKKQREFLEDHLGAWVSDFTEKIEKNARTQFYRGLARSTGIFIRNDLEKLINSTGC